MKECGEVKDVSKKVVDDELPSRNFSKSLILADFETAIDATGFGKFNLILLVASMLSSFTQVFEQMTLSYVLPIAQCDLNLSLGDKGMLNAVSFAGMITSGFIIGYLCDLIGRRKIIVIGYTLQAFSTSLASLSQSFTMLMIAKFFSGFCFNGGFSAITAYLSEWHSSKYRGIVQILRGIGLAVGSILIPLIAWGILPKSINFKLFGTLDIHAWNLYILTTIFAPLSCALVCFLMPESPKFLMTSGKNEEALKVLKKAYKMNTGKSEESFPIKELVDETIGQKRRKSVQKITDSFNAIKPMITPPYVYKLILVCVTFYVSVMGNHSLKLWFPQLFQSINDYKQIHNGSGTDMCNIITFLNGKNTSTSTVCIVNLDNSTVYINAIIIACVQVLLFTIGGFFMKLIGQRWLAAIAASISGSCAIGIYFAKDITTITALFAIYHGLLALVYTNIFYCSRNFPHHFQSNIPFHLPHDRTYWVDYRKYGLSLFDLIGMFFPFYILLRISFPDTCSDMFLPGHSK